MVKINCVTDLESVIEKIQERIDDAEYAIEVIKDFAANAGRASSARELELIDELNEQIDELREEYDNVRCAVSYLDEYRID